MAEQREDRFTELEERYTGYEVHDQHGEKIGEVEDLFVDENDDLEYIGMRAGPAGRRSVLIPMGAVRVDEGRRVIEVPQPKNAVNEGPTFDDAEEITPEFEERVRRHYRLGGLRGPAERDAGEERESAGRARGPERRTGRIAEDPADRGREELRESQVSASREDPSRTESRPDFVGYHVYDRHYEKIGKVDGIFVDEDDQPEYIGMKMGLLGTRTVLIPMDIVRVNDKRRLVEVEAEKATIEEGPTFGDDREVTSGFEERVLSYYRSETEQTSAEERTYGSYYPGATGDGRVDAQPGERAGTHERSSEGRPSAAMGNVDRERGGNLSEALGARRSEEEPGDTRETGRVRIHKRTGNARDE